MSGTGPAPFPFVVGVGRSGTTLLRLMLDAHPDLAIPGETHFVPSLIEAVEGGAGPDRALALVTSADTWPNLMLDASAVARAFAALRPFTAGAAVRALFGLYAERVGKPRWGDKTPTYRRAVARVAGALPEARFVHIIRDGRDVALSYRGLWFGPGDEVEAQACFWVAEIAETRRQAGAATHYMELRFEDLVADPEATLRGVCAFLELPFDPAMLDYSGRAQARMAEYVQTFGPAGPGAVTRERFLSIHDRTQQAPDAGRIGRWRTEMRPDEVERYEAVAGDLLDTLGYRRTGAA